MNTILHELYDNKPPIYFNEYMLYLEVRETKYNLRPHPLLVPRVAHAFVESCLLYKLVKIKNELATYHKLILANIIDKICFLDNISPYRNSTFFI